MNFLRKVAGLRIIDRVRSSDIVEGLKAELLIERLQLRWFRRLVRMLPGNLPVEVFRTTVPFVTTL